MRCEMIREEKIEFTTKWCKYSKYVIEKKDDKYYILPDKNAKPSTYDPFEIKNQILKDLLVIGKESVDNEMFKLVNKEVSIEALSKIEKFQKLVLEFVNNYGLLGNFRFLPESYEFMDNGELPVNLGYNTSINALDFEKKYFWKDSQIDWSSTMKSNDYQRNTGLDNSFKQTEGDRIDDIVFSKNYAETISEIINFATIVYNKNSCKSYNCKRKRKLCHQTFSYGNVLSFTNIFIMCHSTDFICIILDFLP